MILRRHADGQIWAHTGDVGYMDEDGFVYLDSRIKRMIIRHDGFKVFPSMIENVISRHPAVHQCSVVGCTDKDHVQGRLPSSTWCWTRKRQEKAPDRAGTAPAVQ